MLPSFNLKTYLLGLLSFMLVIQVNAQESQADLGQIKVPNPSTYIENYEYDAASCLLYTSPSPRDLSTSRMPSSA